MADAEIHLSENDPDQLDKIAWDKFKKTDPDEAFANFENTWNQITYTFTYTQMVNHIKNTKCF